MKIDGTINHDESVAGSMEAYGITKERTEQINRFVDSLFEEVYGQGITKPKVVEKVIEFADNTVEAVLMYGFFENRFIGEQNEHSLLTRLVEKWGL